MVSAYLFSLQPLRESLVTLSPKSEAGRGWGAVTFSTHLGANRVSLKVVEKQLYCKELFLQCGFFDKMHVDAVKYCILCTHMVIVQLSPSKDSMQGTRPFGGLGLLCSCATLDASLWMVMAAL